MGYVIPSSDGDHVPCEGDRASHKPLRLCDRRVSLVIPGTDSDQRWIGVADLESEGFAARTALEALCLLSELCSATVEEVHALYLDSAHFVIGSERVGLGNRYRAPCNTRALIATALRLDARALIVAHNHPNGDTNPSAQDIACTRQIAEVARAIGVTLIDHLILSGVGWSSFRLMGLL